MVAGNLSVHRALSGPESTFDFVLIAFWVHSKINLISLDRMVIFVF